MKDNMNNEKQTALRALKSIISTAGNAIDNLQASEDFGDLQADETEALKSLNLIYDVVANSNIMLNADENYVVFEGKRTYKHALVTSLNISNSFDEFLSNLNEETYDQHWKVLVLMLVEIAKQKGISQIELAEKTGLMQSNISRVFSTKFCPRLDLFLNIAKAIEVNFFFEDKEDKTELNEIFDAAMTELGRRTDKLNKN